MGRALAEVLTGGGPLLVAGNGGSAAEAQHLTAELVGKLREDRVAPDAPVPVLAATGSRDRPGGAALAAALAVDRDVEVTLVAPVPEGRRWGPRARPARGVRGRAVPAARPRCP